ncbi:NUDIX hydrolase [Bacillus sp. 2205SS5-2]|uniref:NUDIX hydrolase n=1 Tax=Bacillus sp. 2205SS5-2 TaxID=3109031 RepID=UPI003005677B
MGLSRGKVWMCVAGLVLDEKGRWLVVKKKYGGLKGKWSLPAGFVQEGETADEAAIRETKEETGIEAEVQGLIGLRTGVIREEISDNMLVFSLKASNHQRLVPQEKEIMEVRWIDPNDLPANETSTMLFEILQKNWQHRKEKIEDVDPGEVFGYTTYRLFF